MADESATPASRRPPLVDNVRREVELIPTAIGSINQGMQCQAQPRRAQPWLTAEVTSSQRGPRQGRSDPLANTATDALALHPPGG